MMNPDTYAYFALGMLSLISPLEPFHSSSYQSLPRLATKLDRAQPHRDCFQREP